MQQYAEEAVRDYLGKELQPSFFRHWKGIKDAPFVFDKNKSKENIYISQNIMTISK